MKGLDVIESLERARDRRAYLTLSPKASEAKKASLLLAVEVLNQVIEHHKHEERHPTPTYGSLDAMGLPGEPDPLVRA